MSDSTTKIIRKTICPQCSEPISTTSRICNFCGLELSNQTTESNVDADIIPEKNKENENCSAEQEDFIKEFPLSVIIGVPIFLIILFVIIFGFNALFFILPSSIAFLCGVFLVYITLGRYNIYISVVYPIIVSIGFLYLYGFLQIRYSSRNDLDYLALQGFLIFSPYIIAIILFLISIPYKVLKKKKMR